MVKAYCTSLLPSFSSITRIATAATTTTTTTATTGKKQQHSVSVSVGGGKGPHSKLGDLHHGQAVRKAVFGRMFRLPERHTFSVT